MACSGNGPCGETGHNTGQDSSDTPQQVVVFHDTAHLLVIGDGKIQPHALRGGRHPAQRGDCSVNEFDTTVA